MPITTVDEHRAAKYAKAGKLYTVRVRPFGDDNPAADMRVVLKIK